MSRHVRDLQKPLVEPKGKRGKRAVIPGLALNVKEALRRYSAGTLEEQVTNFYFDSIVFPGDENIPDFEKIDRIGRLELLSEHKRKTEEIKKQLTQEQEAAIKDGDPSTKAIITDEQNTKVEKDLKIKKDKE